jgi:hypothetical protein
MNKYLDLEQINQAMVEAGEFAEYDYRKNLLTGYADSGTRQILRNRLRNRGLIAHKLSWEEDVKIIEEPIYKK